jgi:uncharacterized membrane protein YphA (DoxX/SURF4 family)
MPRSALPDIPASPIDWLPTLCRLFLGGLFILAAVLKLSDVQQFVFAVKAFRILPDHLVIFTAFALPVTELIAGVLLVLGLWARESVLVLIGLLAVFIVGVISVLARNMDIKCSCFGDLEWPCKHGVTYCQVIRNLFMIALGLPVLIWGAGKMSLDAKLAKDED